MRIVYHYFTLVIYVFSMFLLFNHWLCITILIGFDLLSFGRLSVMSHSQVFTLRIVVIYTQPLQQKFC